MNWSPQSSRDLRAWVLCPSSISAASSIGRSYSRLAFQLPALVHCRCEVSLPPSRLRSIMRAPWVSRATVNRACSAFAHFLRRHCTSIMTEAVISAIFSGRVIPGLSLSIIDGRLIVDAPEVTLRAGRQAMVPVISGANDFDLAGSAASS